ncbi:hypothetical protein ACHAQJ_001033 [Trichoderma viride]
MKTGAIILSLLAATGLAIPMLISIEEQTQQTQQADQAKMMEQGQMVVNGLFDPPRSGNGNIIGDIFDTAACILGSFIGSRTCQQIVHVTGDEHHNDGNSNSSTSSAYQYSYTTDSDGDYHIQISPSGGKPSCSHTVAKDDASVLANTINQLASKCLSK